MITPEIFYEIFDNKQPYKTQVDHIAQAIITLRVNIPYEVNKSIVLAAEHDKIFLCPVEQAMSHLSIEDVELLAECGVSYEDDHLFLFV